MAKSLEPLTKSEQKLLDFLRERSEEEYVYRVEMKQAEIADQLGITRQALNAKLRPLVEAGYIRTGRGFLELTDRALMAVGQYGRPAFILVRTTPGSIGKVYEEVKQTGAYKVSRVAGDMDILLEVDGASVAETLDEVGGIEGVERTKTYFSLEELS